MSALSLQPVPEFNPDAEVGASLSTCWKKWLADFEMYILASGITNTTRKRALLLYQAGSRVREIFAQLSDTGNADAYDTAKQKLTAYFEPQKNRRYDVYVFRNTYQEQHETLDQYTTRLRTLAQPCEFADQDFELEEQIIIGGTSSKIRKQALRDPKYDLKQMLLDGRRDEISKFQTRQIEAKDNTPEVQANKIEAKCHNCGGKYPHSSACPAKGKDCHKCGKMNHFAKFCRGGKSKPSDQGRKPEKQKPPRRQRQKTLRPLVHSDSSSADSENEYMYAVDKNIKNSPHVRVKVLNHSFDMMVDTGASINVIDRGTYSKLQVNLQETNTKAFPYSSDTPVKFLGKFQALIETKRKFDVATSFVVDKENSGNLLSANTAQQLGVISLHLNKISESSANAYPRTNDRKLNQILEKFEKVFNGLGKLKEHQITVNIDDSVTPVAEPHRRIPYHLRKKVAEAIQQLEQDDIIEKVPDTQATPWISPIVTVPKKDGNSVRICVDMRKANKAIQRVRFLIPTMNDVSHDLNGAQYFSKLDLNQAFHQLELKEESRFITTFSTHVGTYRYKRLHYGMNCSSELFQHTLQTTLTGIQGVRNLHDDIVVFGKSREEHDKALSNCLQRLSENGLTLNPTKCKFLETSLSFFGQIFTADGVRPDPKRVSDLQNAPIPSNVHEVRSLLGMANYSCRYIPDYATITEPLRELTKKNAHFVWKETQQKAFEKLKDALTSAQVMAYFDVNKQSFITVDASPVGISGILSQKSHDSEDYRVVAYASRALSSVEKRYSQTEKEALSIVWAVEHFHLFIYGAPFTLITDHKPLEVIYGNANSKPSARIERWVLRLQPYEFNVVYKPGSENPADFLSRHPTASSKSIHEKMAEEYVNLLALSAVPKALTITEIQEATDADKSLRAVRAAIRNGHWDIDHVKPYKAIKDELTISSHNVILRGSRIVIPESLQQRAVDLAHESHQGLVKTKALLREKVWFPGIDKLTDETIKRCIPCQATGRPDPPQPLTMSELPNGPWQKLHIDFYGPLPSGEYLLVVIDRYSRFPEVEIVRSTKASTVIPKLDKIFAMHGLPSSVTSDNGPPFNGDDYDRYLKHLGIKRDPSTPKWPQGNSEVERFNQTIGKALKTAKIEGRVWQQEINRFLLQYRTTPHSTTKVPPAELLFNRVVNGKLPTLLKETVKNRHKEARNNEQHCKEYNKQYADNKRHAKDSNIKVGDHVLVKQDRENKLTSRFNDKPYIVIYRNKSRVTAQRNNHKVTRNVSHFKQIPKPTNPLSDDDTDIDSTTDNSEQQQLQRHEQQQQRRSSSRQTRQPERYGQPLPSSVV